MTNTKDNNWDKCPKCGKYIDPEIGCVDCTDEPKKEQEKPKAIWILYADREGHC